MKQVPVHGKYLYHTWPCIVQTPSVWGV